MTNHCFLNYTYDNQMQLINDNNHKTKSEIPILDYYFEIPILRKKIYYANIHLTNFISFDNSQMSMKQRSRRRKSKA